MKAPVMHIFASRLVAAATLGLFLPVLSQAQTANLTTSPLTTAGFSTSGTLQSVSSPTYFINDGKTVLIIRGGVVETTATIRTGATEMSQSGYGRVSLTDQVVSIPSATDVLVGPFPPGRWNNPNTGLVRVDFTSITTVSGSAKSLAE